VRGFADEVILSVDAASDPDTVAVAREHADRVELVELAGLPNRAYGWTAERATGDWILALDDDEVVATSLERELRSLLAENVTHYHLPVRWVVRAAGGGLAWIRQFPWYPNHATRLFRNLRGGFHHPPRLHGVWEVAGEGRALPADRASIYHLDLALKDRRQREAKRERYRRNALPGVPTCEEYYLYEDYGSDVEQVPLDTVEPAVEAVLAGSRAPVRAHVAADPLPVISAAQLDAHAADRSPEPPIWSAAYLEHDTPAELGANRGQAVALRVRNTSNGTWRSVGTVVGRVVISYRWRRADGSLAIPQGDVTLLPGALRPGEEASVVAGLWTPSEPGRYLLEWEALCERVAWFSDRGVAPLVHEVQVVDRGERPRAPHFPGPATIAPAAGKAPAPGVALTFDDGPDPDWTPRFLDELRRLDVPATFFVLGERARRQRRLLRKMRRAGHEIGLHGYRHLRHDETDPAEIEEDMFDALAILGRDRVRLWRPPHGIVTAATEALARAHRLELVHWTADTVDWQADQSVEAMLGRVEPLLEPGAVVLMHDAVGPGSPRPDPAPTLALLEPLVTAIRERGLSFSAPAPRAGPRSWGHGGRAPAG
jgi:peptidoglycan/xylan/chitin deacetylase (PgdA/CDA1 family)